MKKINNFILTCIILGVALSSIAIADTAYYCPQSISFTVPNYIIKNTWLSFNVSKSSVDDLPMSGFVLPYWPGSPYYTYNGGVGKHTLSFVATSYQPDLYGNNGSIICIYGTKNKYVSISNFSKELYYAAYYTLAGSKWVITKNPKSDNLDTCGEESSVSSTESCPFYNAAFD